MSMSASKTIDYLLVDYTDTEHDLRLMDEAGALQIQIDDGLERALAEMQGLRDQLSATECASLIDLCKNTVVETITGQFGLASLFIAAKDGGNVTTAHNFEAGITATGEDAAKYKGYAEIRDNVVVGQDKKGKNIKAYQRKRKDIYDPVHKEKRGDYIPKEGTVIDAYTGKEIPVGEANLDHIVPIREIEENAKAHLAMSDTERAELACSDQNYAVTSETANKSKGPKPIDEFAQSEKAQELGINEDIAKKEDKTARKHVYGTINTNQAKKYTKELLSTGGRDAANMAAYTVLGIVMRDVVQTVFVEIHITLEKRGTESFSEIFSRFKTSLLSGINKIKDKWKENLLEVGLSAGTAFISNLAVFAVNLFATTLKKIVSMIRAGIASIVQAVKIIANPPAGMPKEEVRYQALKILTAGIIGAASLGLSAGIEKFLQAIPGLQPLMMFPIPSFGKETRTVSDAIAVTLSALAGGLVTTIVLYFMDKLHNENKKAKLQIELVNQSGVVVQYSLAQTWLSLEAAYRLLNNVAAEFAYCVNDANALIVDSGQKADAAINRLKQTNERLKGLKKS